MYEQCEGTSRLHCGGEHSAAAAPLSGARVQVLFLGQLTMIESAKLTERLAKFIMLKMVFLGAISAPTRVQMVMWFSW